MFFILGEYRVGNRKAEPVPNILLNGLSIQKEHAKVVHDDSTHSIKITPSTGAKVLVNGLPRVDECELHHGDRSKYDFLYFVYELIVNVKIRLF